MILIPGAIRSDDQVVYKMAISQTIVKTALLDQFRNTIVLLIVSTRAMKHVSGMSVPTGQCVYLRRASVAPAELQDLVGAPEDGDGAVEGLTRLHHHRTLNSGTARRGPDTLLHRLKHRLRTGSQLSPSQHSVVSNYVYCFRC